MSFIIYTKEYTVEDKIVGTSEDEKRFLQINMDPLDNRMHKANIRFINLDDVKQVVIIGPVTNSLVGIDLNQPESVIDETQYKSFESLLTDSMFTFDLHILLKNGEIISRIYLNSMMDELMKIGRCLSANSIIIDDLRSVRFAKAKLKFCVRSEEIKEPDGRILKYKEVEIDGEVDMDDGKVMLISKTLDIIRDIFRIPRSDKDESE